MAKGDFIEIQTYTGGGKIISVDIDGITPEGYELLNSIRDDTIWNNAKKKLGGAANLSIKAVASVVAEAATAYLKSKIGL